KRHVSESYAKLNSGEGRSGLNDELSPYRQSTDVIKRPAQEDDRRTGQDRPPSSEVREHPRRIESAHIRGGGQSHGERQGNHHSADPWGRNRVNLTLPRQIDGADDKCEPTNQRTEC